MKKRERMEIGLVGLSGLGKTGELLGKFPIALSTHCKSRSSGYLGSWNCACKDNHRKVDSYFQRKQKDVVLGT